MHVFAVQTIPEGNPQSEFVLVRAEDANQALAFAAQQSIEAGKPDTAMVAVFSLPELEALVSAMRSASDNASD